MRTRTVLRFCAAAALAYTLALTAQSRFPLSAKALLAKSLAGTQASAVLLDSKTGAIIAAVGVPRRGAPGSILKPLLLDYALEHQIVQPQMQVYCRRDLQIAGRSLPCTHPANEPVFTAESALAESCNTWFAEMGRRFTGPGLDDAMRATHLQHTSLIHADVAQRQLAVLGLQGVTASTLDIAHAYRTLLLHTSQSGPVTHGLRASVNYGMANQAKVPGLDILGKTGTASDPGEAWTHGWFAGALPGRFILVVYVPHGDGGTAAALAGGFFTNVAVNGSHP